MERALYQEAANLGSRSFPLASRAFLDKYLSHLIYKMDIITAFLLRQKTVSDGLRCMGPFPASL